MFPQFEHSFSSMESLKGCYLLFFCIKDLSKWIFLNHCIYISIHINSLAYFLEKVGALLRYACDFQRPSASPMSSYLRLASQACSKLPGRKSPAGTQWGAAVT